MRMVKGTLCGEAIEVVARSAVSPEQIDRERSREMYILSLAGRSLRQIAEKYNVSHMTVKNRIREIPESDQLKLRRQFFGSEGAA